MPPKAKPPTQQPRPTPPAATAPHSGSPSCSNGAAGGTPCPGFKADLLVAIFKTELQAALTENLSNIKTELRAVKSKLSDSITNIQSDVCALKGTVGEMETSLSSCTDDITTLQAKVAHLSTELIRLDNKCEDLEARSRRNNIRLVGIPEDFSTSSTATAISTLLKEALELQKEPLVDRAHLILQPKPKPGTTWMQEIVPLIMSGGDPASVETLPNWRRVPWMEVDNTCKLNLEQRPSPRILSTHFQYAMMPPSFSEIKPKVIYVMRNPKDVFTSSFHFYGMTSFLVKPGPQSEFLHKFLDGKVMFGSWFDHVKSWLNAEDKDRIMYISYEEMIMDLKDSVARIAQFLEKPLDTEVMEKIADRCLFKNMKQNKMSNYSTVPRVYMDQTKSEFLRKGIAGDWKNQLTVAEAEYFEAVYKDKMKDVKYKFAWD
ncbi:Bile salt sulfotransferase [Larimichthys crocea]|uniref:Sulfotransferase n=1 Tax=Larimichthys crocea TaxID=215358 RepID=A0A6G0HZH2_LARCR|nr:Bile salt sulfotransferase [Larimichthys crocea]